MWMPRSVCLGEAAMFFHLLLASKYMRTSKQFLTYKNFHCTLNMILHWKKSVLKIYIYICLIKLTKFLAKGTNRDIYRSITTVVKDGSECARMCLFTLIWGIRRKKIMLKKIALLKSHFSIKVQKVSFLVSQFYSQLSLVNQVTVQLPGRSQSMFYCNSVYKYSIPGVYSS